ncbi:MAG: helix-turn-helix domain-containing protein [Acidobacteriota bacterium]|nr:helix-turn-helix domain-containing protein [Acidobacteriota bacterium]
MGVWDRLPQALRKLRILRRMTQRELAAAAGIGTSAIYSYESGHHLPRLDTLGVLMEVLEVDLSDLTPLLNPPAAAGSQSASSQSAGSQSTRQQPDRRYRPPRRPGLGLEEPAGFIEEVGRGIAWLRQSQRLTLHEVASAAGLSQSTLSRIERGQQDVKGEALGKILEALDADLLRLALTVKVAGTLTGEQTLREDADDRELVSMAIAALGLEEAVRLMEN